MTKQGRREVPGSTTRLTKSAVTRMLMDFFRKPPDELTGEGRRMTAEDRRVIDALVEWYERKCESPGPRFANASIANVAKLAHDGVIDLLEDIPVPKLDAKIADAMEEHSEFSRSGNHGVDHPDRGRTR